MYGLVQQLSRGHAAGILVADGGHAVHCGKLWKNVRRVSRSGLYVYICAEGAERAYRFFRWVGDDPRLSFDPVAEHHLRRFDRSTAFTAGAVYSLACLSLFCALINILGIRMTARAGSVMMAIMTVFAVVFVILAARYIVHEHGWHGLIQQVGWYRADTFSLRALMLGAGVAAISYIGFDAISTLAEDTVSPERDIGFATLLVCVIQTAICVLTVYLAALVWPDFKSYPEAETVILDIGRRIGGPWVFGSLTVVLMVAGLASALTGQAGASRLLYGMGRDGVLPRRIFGYINPRFATPTRGIYLMGAASLIGSLYLRFEIAVELLNFGAFAGFILVNLSVIRHFFFRLHQRKGRALISNLLAPALGAAVCIYLWMSLSLRAKEAGFIWLAVGVLYLAFLTKGFKAPPVELSSLWETN